MGCIDRPLSKVVVLGIAAVLVACGKNPLPESGPLPVVGVEALVVPASAAEPVAGNTPAIVYDMGGKLDRSFNEAAYRGMERWKADSGRSYLEYEIASEAQREPALRRMAERGASPIVGVGFGQASSIAAVAKDFPKLKFVVVDVVVNAPNVQSVVFKEHEGSFLVGAMAAMASKSGKLGFVGGMDIPLIEKFQCGYLQGAQHVRPQADVLANMVGTTGAAWNDPARGGALARAQFSKGVDVVFAAAGGSGTGVYQAAKDAGKLAIGVDSNQNYLQPGVMLTSMLKRVDVAVYNALKGYKPGTMILGLKEGGVDVALDEYNAKLVTPAMRSQLETIKADIIGGKIKVADYMANNSCTY